jgi:3-dehydroquinate dehydratase/shikimate dehydrogenase
MLCVSLTPATPEDIFNSDIRLADYIEVRLDYLKDPQSARNISWSKLKVPVIATCRRAERGGRFNGSRPDELFILQDAIRNGAAFVDLDYRDVEGPLGAPVIGSFHDFAQTPDDIDEHLAKACANPAIAIAKVAATPNSWSDNRRLLELLNKGWSKPVIVVGMGELGQITRIVGPARGSRWTYATTDQPSGEPAAQGQLTAEDLVDRYRYRRIRAATNLFGVVGNPVTQSRGYILHNRAFETASVDFAYLKFPVRDVRDFFENATAIGIRGFSVTMPHKTAVIPFLSEVAAAAREAGAVNTVVYSERGWVGDNSDVYGARTALAAAHFDPSGKTVVIMGAGGASKAAVVAVQGAGQVVVLPRSEVRTGGEYDCDLLINATPIGMAPNVNDSPIEGPLRARVVFDMVYTPRITKLLKTAQEQGKQIVPGTEMFYAQAARQFEIWTGSPAPAGIYAPEAV